MEANGYTAGGLPVWRIMVAGERSFCSNKDMCTAILGLEPGSVFLAGVRDELIDRAWQAPGWYWPDFPGVIGGRDLLAGGTWLAVAPAARRVACVLNGMGRMAPAGSRRSRGVLPLGAAAGGKLARGKLAAFDPFHLLLAEPGRAALWSWDGEQLAGKELMAGLHMVVNSGLAGSIPPADGDTQGMAHETARIAHFLPRLQAAPRPDPKPGVPVREAWGAWLPLLNGDGIGPDDLRALIVRRDLGGGRIWGTTSISLISVTPEGMRYDFTPAPGDPAAWYPVPLGMQQERGLCRR
ncbi:MAG TPA: NRDE family protein [Streptosporangiaceae bacterium]|jgi:hypothetical protein|nr:NRDE family protein [Streptosporangiaceae bacterium]